MLNIAVIENRNISINVHKETIQQLKKMTMRICTDGYMGINTHTGFIRVNLKLMNI